MDIEQFRKAGYAAIDRICDYYYSIQNLPVKPSVKPGYLREHIPETAPVQGEPWQALLSDYTKLILPGLVHWQHPSFFAFFPTACTFEGMLADLLSTSVCNPGFHWAASPACTELEVIMMDWAANLLGLHKDFFNASGVGGGAIQNTASESAITAIVAARSRYTRLHPTVLLENLLVYTTTQTHSLGLKAGKVLGLEVKAIEVKAEDDYALRGETLRRSLEEDLKNGKHPFVLIATLGTTSSGAVDNMAEIREVAKDYPDLWIHVDAAWAGSALACPEYRDKLYHDDTNAVATSFCTNFHKWGLVNFDCSTLWVRDRNLLTEALDITPPYLRTKEGSNGLTIDYRNWHLALGRRFRSIKLWFVLRGFGVEGFRKYIRQCINNSDVFVRKLETDIPELELVTAPSLALSVFRVSPSLGTTSSPGSPTSAQPNGHSYNGVHTVDGISHDNVDAANGVSHNGTDTVNDSSHNGLHTASGLSAPNAIHLPPYISLSKTELGLTLDQTNTLTRALFNNLNSRTDIALTQTVLNGVACIRFVVGSARTTVADIERAVEILREEVNMVIRNWRAEQWGKEKL